MFIAKLINVTTHQNIIIKSEKHLSSMSELDDAYSCNTSQSLQGKRFVFRIAPRQ